MLRDLINYSPVVVGTGYVFAQIKSGIDVDYVAALAARRWRNYARRDAMRFYGPDHPQAV